MCGIAGIFNFDGRPVAQQTIDRFTDSLAHRGPDGRGTWRNNQCGIALGHRRLAILDLSASGHQPMSYLDSRYTITYNGEVYNFLEIRAELENHGYKFFSDSDTEVILAAYDKWGPEMLERFNGMWAFAIWDHSRRSLFLSRDRFGIKPLLYRLTDHQFAFASELKAFRRLDEYSPEIDSDSSRQELLDAFALEGSQRTLFLGVNRLQGGHYAFIANGQMQLHRWWRTVDHLITVPSRLEEQAERFMELFQDAVRLRMRSDVPIGTCLSGGFDSTAVLTTMAALGQDSGCRAAREWQRAFVATFPGADNDERPQANEAARYTGVAPRFLEVHPEDSLNVLDRFLDDIEDITWNPGTPAWLIYRELRRQQTVVSIDGHGADELMGAYKQAADLALADAPSVLTHPIDNLRRMRAVFQAKATSMLGGSLLGKLKYTLYSILFHHPEFVPIRKIARRVRRLGIRNSGTARFIKNLPILDVSKFSHVGSDDLLPEAWPPLSRELYRMFHSTILPTILRNFDRVSMAHGVEVRMPFMDWRLACYIMSLPLESKIGGGQTKRIARVAMLGHMPDSIRLSKMKMGFNAPLPQLLNDHLMPWFEDRVAPALRGDHPLIYTRDLMRYVHKHSRNRSWTWGNCSGAWIAINYIWFERHFCRA